MGVKNCKELHQHDENISRFLLDVRVHFLRLPVEWGVVLELAHFELTKGFSEFRHFLHSFGELGVFAVSADGAVDGLQALRHNLRDARVLVVLELVAQRGESPREGVVLCQQALDGLRAVEQVLAQGHVELLRRSLGVNICVVRLDKLLHVVVEADAPAGHLHPSVLAAHKQVESLRVIPIRGVGRHSSLRKHKFCPPIFKFDG